MTFNLIDLVSDSKIVTKKENKKKLHKLLDKYGSVEEIERSGDLRNGFEFDFARIDGANDFGYPCKKLLTKQMIPMLNKINKDTNQMNLANY